MRYKKLIPVIVLEELEKCGFAWRLEYGNRHIKIFILNHLAGILPFSSKARDTKGKARSNLNVRADIRRLVRNLSQSEQPVES